MRYTVTYTRDALDALARVWLAAADRAAVKQAGDDIDRLLGTDAHDKGMVAHGMLRELVVHPLQIYFTVSEDDRLVTVWFVRAISNQST